jgi:hypothetical protein
MMKALLLAAVFTASAHGGAVELTSDNVDSIIAGKNSFVRAARHGWRARELGTMQARRTARSCRARSRA